jgi:hypothetical protein
MITLNLRVMNFVIVKNEDDLDHLIVPLCADAIEIEGRVQKTTHIVIQDKDLTFIVVNQ